MLVYGGRHAREVEARWTATREGAGLILETLTERTDDKGNVVKLTGDPTAEWVRIEIRGSNNRVEIAAGAKITYLHVIMEANNARFSIGPRDATLSATVRVGQDSSVTLGTNVSTTERVVISAAEGVDVDIGDDCVIGRNVQIRGEDTDPIRDARTGQRANRSRAISIGPHVSLAPDVTVLKGANIGSTTSIGASSVVSQEIPTNCVALGMPAKVVRRYIPWERPRLTAVRPSYRPGVPPREAVTSLKYHTR